MKLFLLEDLQAGDGGTRYVVARAESEARVRELVADQEAAFRWRDPERTRCTVLSEEGPSGVVWVDP